VPYQAEGLDGLPGERTGRPVGSGRTLTDEQAAHLQQLDRQQQPCQAGIKAPLWSRDAVRELIHKEYGIWMPVRTVGEYLKTLGLHRQEAVPPCQRPGSRGGQKVVEETYPDIERQAEEEEAVILWTDESGVDADHHPGTGYARKGERATMEVPHSHIRRSVNLGSRQPWRVSFMTYTGTLDAGLFIVFLEGLLTETTKKIYLITDRLSAHDCEEVWDWVEEHKDRIAMFLLPRRSPELNPRRVPNNDLKG